jgi:hypothetical protein
MKALLSIAAVAAGLALAACGESEEDKAMNDVCDARAGIQDKLDQLGDLTVTSASIDQVREIFEGIGNDVEQIADAQPDLGDERREQVDTANQQFRDAAGDTLGNVVSGASGDDAQAQLESAASELTSAYREAYEPLDCG